jgi:hypothetical protein
MSDTLPDFIHPAEAGPHVLHDHRVAVDQLPESVVAIEM